uniref:site-specific DNA-methyltransferase (adenine-specific) n=1 Tax=Aliivibrio fischeri TaxID=668 RepID=H2ERT3_ALIFS|nr:N-6 DNA methylase [Aliivibrio fischeri]AEY78100.1 Type I restriction enzyme M protein [Aliivibrio fischeri]
MNNPVIKLMNDLRDTLSLNEIMPAVAQSFLLLKRSDIGHLSDSLTNKMLWMEFDELNKQYQEFGFHLPLVDIDKLQPFISDFVKRLVELYKLAAINDNDLFQVLDYLAFTQGKGGMTAVPKEIVRLGKGLLPNTKDSVYCPFDSSYFFAEVMDGDVGYEAQSIESITMALTRSELLNKVSYDIRQSDPLSNPKFITHGGLEQFEHSIGFPPFNLKLGKEVPRDLWGRFVEKSSNGYVYQLRHMLAHSYSHVVVCVANSFLTSSVSSEATFKQNMLDKGWLKAVISLPGNLLNSTSIPFSIIILDKDHHGKSTLVIDASDETVFTENIHRIQKRLTNVSQILELYHNREESDYSALVTAEQIQKNNMSLMPSRYVMTQKDRIMTRKLSDYHMINLSDIAVFIRPQMIKSEMEGEAFTEVVLSNINEIGQVKGQLKQVVLKQNRNKASEQVLRKGDILLSSRGTVGRVGLIDRDEKNMLASQVFTIIRLKPYISITPEFVYQYLVSELGQWQLNNLITGSSQSILSPKDLNALQIPELLQSEIKKAEKIRAQIVKKYQQLETIKHEIKNLNDNAWFIS